MCTTHLRAFFEFSPSTPNSTHAHTSVNVTSKRARSQPQSYILRVTFPSVSSTIFYSQANGSERRPDTGEHRRLPPGEYAGSRVLTCRFGDPRKENCDMMCRPLRAVMVGHRYAIIVPKVRGIRRAPRSRPQSLSADPSHFPSVFLLRFLFLTSAPGAYALLTRRRGPSLSRVQPPRRGATRVNGTPVRPVVATGRPAALEPVGIGGGPLPAYALALSHAETKWTRGGDRVVARRDYRASSSREHSRGGLRKEAPRTVRSDSARTPITLAVVEERRDRVSFPRKERELRPAHRLVA